MTQEYRVTYRDRRKQFVTADSCAPHQEYWMFTLNGVETFISRQDVESVLLAETPEPTMRAPRMGAV